MSTLQHTPHRRQNILTGDWILVSPHRTKRPWQGKVEKPELNTRPNYDPKCYLCPGNTRANGVQNPDYQSTYAFTNDFPALLPETELVKSQHDFFKHKTEKGTCRVICFSPNHALTLPEMEVADIVNVVELWQQEYRTLGALDYINHVQIFENKGAMMGCSNPPPAWAGMGAGTGADRGEKEDQTPAEIL